MKITGHYSEAVFYAATECEHCGALDKIPADLTGSPQKDSATLHCKSCGKNSAGLGIHPKPKPQPETTTALAKIESANIQFDSNDQLSISLFFNTGAPTLATATVRFQDPSIVGNYISRLLSIADADSWRDLQGNTVRLKTDLTTPLANKDNSITAIGSTIYGDWISTNPYNLCQLPNPISRPK